MTDSSIALLGPWRAALQKLRLSAPIGDMACKVEEDGRRLLWLEEQSRRFNANKEMVEGICLLNRLATIDAEAWRREVLSVWNDSRELLRVTDDSREEAYRHPLTRVVPWTMGMHSNTLKAMNNITITVASTEFRELWEQWAIEHGDAPAELYSVPWRIELTARDIVPARKSVKDIIKFVQAQQQQLKTNRAAAMPYAQVEEVGLEYPSVTPLVTHGMALLMQLVNLGVVVYHVPIFLMEETPSNTRLVVDALRCLLQLPETTPSSSSTVGRGARVFYVSWEESYYSLSCLSAAQHAQSLDRLDMTCDSDWGQLDWLELESMRFTYRCLAYCVFSRYAHHNLKALRFSVEFFNDELLEIIEDVLQTDENPLQQIFRGSEPRQPRVDQIAASTFYLEHPIDFIANERRAIKAKYTTKSPIAARVINETTIDGANWWTVLLPGHGEAWVRDQDRLPVRGPHRVRPRTTAPAFPSIILSHLNAASCDSVCGLLRLIGHGTQQLIIEETHQDIVYASWLLDVFEACPQLRHLKMWADFSDHLSVFVTAAAEGNCRLEKLELVHVMPPSPEHVSGFFHALCDAGHPLTKHLKTLNLGFDLPHDKADYVIEPLQQLLRENTTLVDIKISFGGFSSSTIADEEAIASQFAEQLAKPIVTRTAPLELARKLAFLSVTSHTAMPTAAVGRLDSLAISTIFQYAAYGRKRVFSLRFRWLNDEFLQQDIARYAALRE